MRKRTSLNNQQGKYEKGQFWEGKGTILNKRNLTNYNSGTNPKNSNSEKNRSGTNVNSGKEKSEKGQF